MIISSLGCCPLFSIPEPWSLVCENLGAYPTGFDFVLGLSLMDFEQAFINTRCVEMMGPGFRWNAESEEPRLGPDSETGI